MTFPGRITTILTPLSYLIAIALNTRNEDKLSNDPHCVAITYQTSAIAKKKDGIKSLNNSNMNH
jgi:hypothetical protein